MTVYPVHPYCTFKTELVEERTQFLCDTAREVLHFMAEHCKDRGLPLVITDSVSTAAEDKALSRVSDEHAQGRAFDLSLHGWLELAITDFIAVFEARFMCVAAIGKKTNEPRLIFRHVGTADHLHIQVARCFGVKDPLKLAAERPEEPVGPT